MAAASFSSTSMSPARLLAWIGCATLALVALRGVHPIVPVEGDEQGVLFGVEGMVRGTPELLARRYLFEVQPGSYQTLAALVRGVGVSPETAFATTTLFGALLFALAGATLLSVTCSVAFPYALLAMLWCQETITGACYLNTTTLAAGVAVLSLLPFACNARLAALLAGGCGLGLAGWLRGDALLISPAALALLVHRRGFVGSALRDTAFAAMVSGAVFWLLRETSGAPLREGLSTYASLSSQVASARNTRDVIVTLLSPALLLLSLAGFIWLTATRSYALLFVALAGTIPALLAYRGALVSTKYLYCTVPFAVLPALALLRALAVRGAAWRPAPRLLLGGAAAVLAAGDLGAGVRLLRGESCYYTPAPAWLSVELGSSQRHLALGGGDIIPNEDGFRLRTGQIFAPAVWRREKLHQVGQLELLRAIFARETDATIFFAGWLPEQMVSRELFRAGFTPQAIPAGARWSHGARRIEMIFLGHVGSPHQPPGLAPARTGACYFVGLYGGKVAPTELADGGRWQPFSAPTEGFLTLYRRDRSI